MWPEVPQALTSVDEASNLWASIIEATEKEVLAAHDIPWDTVGEWRGRAAEPRWVLRHVRLPPNRNRPRATLQEAGVPRRWIASLRSALRRGSPSMLASRSSVG